MESGVKAIAYETIVGRSGGLPCLTPMSEIAGRMSVQEGAKYLEKTFGGRGVLLAGVPGVARANVVILGGGNVGTNACKIAVGMGANVTIWTSTPPVWPIWMTSSPARSPPCTAPARTSATASRPLTWSSAPFSSPAAPHPSWSAVRI